jgi:hypothetical protein
VYVAWSLWGQTGGRVLLKFSSESIGEFSYFRDDEIAGGGLGLDANTLTVYSSN